VPKLLDFGIAKAQADDFETQTGALLGTPGYMAPEQARDGHCGAFTDVWGLGAVLDRCVVGHPPHRAASVPETLAKLMTEPVPSVVLEGVRRADSAALDRALERDPERRYQTMQAFVRALEATSAQSGNTAGSDAPDLFTETLEVSHPLPEPSRAPVRIAPRRTSRLARALQGAAALVLLAFVVAVLPHDKRSPRPGAGAERRMPPAAAAAIPLSTSAATPVPPLHEPDGPAREALAPKAGEPRATPSHIARKRALRRATDGPHGAPVGSTGSPAPEQPDYQQQAGVPVITEW